MNHDSSDILIELLEVFINHILYVRGVYPAEIFKKRKMYNTAVYISIYPPLNTYLFNTLNTAREFKKNKQLHRIEMVILRDDRNIFEKYSFDINDEWAGLSTNGDENLLKFEGHLRESLYTFSKRAKPLQKLPHDVTFKILIHSTESSFIRWSHNSAFQEFPWLQTSSETDRDNREIPILPITSIDSVGIKTTMEILN